MAHRETAGRSWCVYSVRWLYRARLLLVESAACGLDGPNSVRVASDGPRPLTARHGAVGVTPCWMASGDSASRKSRKQARPGGVHDVAKTTILDATATCFDAVDVDSKATATWLEAKTSCKTGWLAILNSTEKGRWLGLWTQVRTDPRGDTEWCPGLSGTTTVGGDVVTRPKRSPQTGVSARGIVPQIQDWPESPTEESHPLQRWEEVKAVLNSPIHIGSCQYKIQHYAEVATYPRTAALCGESEHANTSQGRHRSTVGGHQRQ